MALLDSTTLYSGIQVTSHPYCSQERTTIQQCNALVGHAPNRAFHHTCTHQSTWCTGRTHPRSTITVHLSKYPLNPFYFYPLSLYLLRALYLLRVLFICICCLLVIYYIYTHKKWLYLALLDSTTLYHGSNWLYMTILHSTMALLDSTWLYLTLLHYMWTLLGSTGLQYTPYHGSTWLYWTLLHSALALLGSTLLCYTT